MWKNFYTDKKDFNKIISNLGIVKENIIDLESKNVKKYFANKLVTYFDNLMLLKQKNGIHGNLLEALSIAEKDMLNIDGVFPNVYCYLIEEDSVLSVLFRNYKEDYNFIKTYFNSTDYSWNNSVNIDELMFESWCNVMFDINQINYSVDWIEYVPSLEDRCTLQAEYILYQTTFKSGEFSLLEKIAFEKNIKNHPQYEKLIDRLIKVMPKIENYLQHEWEINNSIIQEHNQIKRSLKNKK